MVSRPRYISAQSFQPLITAIGAKLGPPCRCAAAALIVEAAWFE